MKSSYPMSNQPGAVQLEPLLKEAGELTAIFAAAIKTGRDKH